MEIALNSLGDVVTNVVGFGGTWWDMGPIMGDLWLLG